MLAQSQKSQVQPLARALTYTFLNVINLINFTGSYIPHLKNGMVDLGE